MPAASEASFVSSSVVSSTFVSNNVRVKHSAGSKLADRSSIEALGSPLVSAVGAGQLREPLPRTGPQARRTLLAGAAGRFCFYVGIPALMAGPAREISGAPEALDQAYSVEFGRSHRTIPTTNVAPAADGQ